MDFRTFDDIEKNLGRVLDLGDGYTTLIDENGNIIKALRIQEKVLEDTYSRDLEQINKVKHERKSFEGKESSSEEDAIIDLTKRPGDISTLDGVEASGPDIVFYRQDLENRINLKSGFGMREFNYEQFYKGVLNEKINESFNKNGCLTYMGGQDNEITTKV